MKQENKFTLYDDQEGKCYFCKMEFPIESLHLEHLFPRSKSTKDLLKNLVLCCPKCNANRVNIPLREIELIHILRQLLDRHPDFRNITQEGFMRKGSDFRADIIAEQKINNKWIKLLIEIKSFPTFISEKLSNLATQLKSYKDNINDDATIVLAFPGILPEADNLFIKLLGIEIWDRDFIAKTFKNEIEQVENKQFLELFSFPYFSPEEQETLIEDLKSIQAGRTDWLNYQKHVEKILSYLFSDVLSDPISELPDKYGINRRDFILRNYCENGFWKYLRERYQADFIVIDAKNYNGKIKKNQILQLSNYLKGHGTGLFAMIISRSGVEDTGSYYTRKEVWVTERKMIIILDDNDMEKMILAKASSNQPEEIIRQKIEGFRLEM